MAYNYLNKVGLTNLWGNIKAYITSKLSSKAEDNSVVHLANTESIRGLKYFTKDIYNKNENTVVAETPTTNQYIRYRFTDNNNDLLASIQYANRTTGARDLAFYLSTADGTTLGVIFNTNKSFYPLSDNYSLGASDRKWANVYATNFTGDLGSFSSKVETPIVRATADLGLILANKDSTAPTTTNGWNQVQFFDKNMVQLGYFQLVSSNSANVYNWVGKKNSDLSIRRNIFWNVDAGEFGCSPPNTISLGTSSNKWSQLHCTEITTYSDNFQRNIYGDYGTLWRRDWGGLYLLLTDRGNPNGPWNSARPITVDLASGICNINGNAVTATKATQDASGNVITTTYATKAENSLKANNANVVHTSGDETISGTKNFTSNVINKITTYAVTDTPTSNKYRQYLFLDKNDTSLGFLQYASRTTGVRDLALYVNDKDRNTHGIQINSENYVLPIGNNSYCLGSTTSKWKSAYINSMISANITLSDPNFLRCTYGSYGTFWRQDGTNLYLMLTNKDDQYGHWNSFRPIQVSLSTGKCYINGVDPSASNADVVGKTVTAYYTTASLSGRTDIDFSGNGTRSFSTKTNTITPTVGTIYSGAQLYAIAVGSGSWSKSGNVSENNIYINQVLNSLLEFTGQYSSSAKYLCTTAQGVYNTSSGSSTLTNYSKKGNSSGGFKATGTLTNGTITNTIGGGKSTFLRVQ